MAVDMNEGFALYQNILEERTIESPFLVFADWLDENAEFGPQCKLWSKQAEFIRLSVKLQEMGMTWYYKPPTFDHNGHIYDRFVKLRQEIMAIRHSINEHAIMRDATHYAFKNGFVQRACLTPIMYPAGRIWLASYPVTHLMPYYKNPIDLNIEFRVFTFVVEPPRYHRYLYISSVDISSVNPVVSQYEYCVDAMTVGAFLTGTRCTVRFTHNRNTTVIMPAYAYMTWEKADEDLSQSTIKYCMRLTPDKKFEQNKPRYQRSAFNYLMGVKNE